jgi:hypothetical protein
LIQKIVSLKEIDGDLDIAKLIRRDTNEPVQGAFWKAPALLTLVRLDFVGVREYVEYSITHSHGRAATHVEFFFNIVER